MSVVKTRDLCYVEIVVPGTPKTWHRMRTMGKRRFEDTHQRTNKSVLVVLALKSLGGDSWPHDWIYRVRIDAYWKLADNQHRKKHPVPMEPRPATPDGDNMMKLVGDALEGVLWDNDKRIVDHRVLKWRANQGEPSRTVIRVWAIRPGSEWRDVIGRDN